MASAPVPLPSCHLSSGLSAQAPGREGDKAEAEAEAATTTTRTTANMAMACSVKWVLCVQYSGWGFGNNEMCASVNLVVNHARSSGQQQARRRRISRGQSTPPARELFHF